MSANNPKQAFKIIANKKYLMANFKVKRTIKIIVFLSFMMFLSTSIAANENKVLSYFQKKNPNITEVQIIEYVSNYHFANGLLVVRGIKPANKFTGNWDDELFGIFQTNKDLKITRAIDFITTKRWHDYCVDVKRMKLSHYIVRFYGCSYSDSEMIREYVIE